MAPRRIQKQMLSSSQYTHLGFGHDVVFEQLLSISLAAGLQMGARCLTCCIMMGLSGHSPCSGAETAFLGAKFPVAERSAEIWGGGSMGIQMQAAQQADRDMVCWKQTT